MAVYAAHVYPAGRYTVPPWPAHAVMEAWTARVSSATPSPTAPQSNGLHTAPLTVILIQEPA